MPRKHCVPRIGAVFCSHAPKHRQRVVRNVVGKSKQEFTPSKSEGGIREEMRSVGSAHLFSERPIDVRLGLAK
jgi:hypothetical protein